MVEEIIKIKIRKLLKDFEQYPNKYLTEEDVRCFLVANLLEHPEFNALQDTSDNSKSISLHTEVRWYGNSGQLKWRSDIVIIDVSSLRVRESLFKIPSKGYSFNKPLAIIEIKLRRINGGSDNFFLKKIEEDIDKLKRIKREVSGSYSCYLITLDKKNDISNDVNQLDENISLFYKYSSF